MLKFYAYTLLLLSCCGFAYCFGYQQANTLTSETVRRHNRTYYRATTTPSYN